MSVTTYSLPRIRILNPNTSALVSDILLSGARQAAAGRAEIRVGTARFGATVLESPVDLVRAADAIVEMAEAETWADALIVGAFGEPGLERLRRTGGRRVTGIGTAGMRAAARFGSFEILTLGPAMTDDILAKTEALGVSDRLTGLGFLPSGILDVARDPGGFHERILQAARQAAGRGAACLLLGGAPFSGMACSYATGSPIPVIDGTSMALEATLRTLTQR